MARAMENLEYRFICNEFSGVVINGHFSNLYKVGEGSYRMKIGSTQIVIDVGERIGIAKYIKGALDPDNFILRAKKFLDNKKLIRITQINKDRILVFEFADDLNLVFEGFGKGNLILVGSGKTICAYKEEKWSDRQIKLGIEYSYPKNTIAIDLRTVLNEKYLISSMLKLPLGKEYCKEVLARLGIDEKKTGKDLTEQEIKKIEEEIFNIEKKLEPVVFVNNGEVKDFGLIRFTKYCDLEVKKFETLSSAMEEYYGNFVEVDEKLESLNKRLEKQLERLDLLKKEEIERKEIGDLVYQNYEKIEEIVNRIKKLGVEKASNEFKIDKKNKTVELEI